MRKQTTAAIAAAAALTAGSLAWAAPASADLTTRCVGEGGAVTVPGDLVVPRDSSCTLTGTTVSGDVRVAPGANLIAQNATIEGRVVAAADAYFEAIDSTVGGQVALNDAYGSYVDNSELGDRVITRAGDSGAIGGFVYTFEADIAGNLVSRGGEVFVESSQIGGTVNSRDSLYTDLYESFVDGGLVVRGNELGGVLCASAVQGETRFAGNTELVQLGSAGPFADCAGGSYFGDNVTVNGTTGGVYVDNSIVNGDLTLRNNDPVAQVGANTMVRGSIVGDYEDWDGSAPMTLQRRSGDAESAPAQRDDVLEAKIAKRHQAAVNSADRAGTASIGR